MNAMDVIVLCFSGLTVLAVSIIQYIESLQEKVKAEQGDDVRQSSGIGSSAVDSAEESSHKEGESVCAERESENQEICENIKRADFQEVAEVKEEEIEEEKPACVSGQESDFSSGFMGISGNNGGRICEKRGSIDKRSDFCNGFSGISENNGGDICERSGIIDQESDSCNNGDDICGKKVTIEDNNNGEGEEEIVDDWEGVERTELEKIFGEALIFVNCKSNADQIGDLNLQLYGLQRVALDGPCHRPQPMALKVSARSKCNAWQKLGSMSRETAMQMYVDILSKAIPHWKGEDKLTVQDESASSSSSNTKGSASSSSSSSVSVSGPPCGSITEDEIRAFLSDKKPVTPYELIVKFDWRMKLKEEKDAFTAMLIRIAKLHETN